jgi:hypothetical protein
VHSQFFSAHQWTQTARPVAVVNGSQILRVNGHRQAASQCLLDHMISVAGLI